MKTTDSRLYSTHTHDNSWQNVISYKCNNSGKRRIWAEIVCLKHISHDLFYRIIMQICLHWRADLFYVRATLETGEKRKLRAR